jgi:hypothetical protein
MYSGHGPGWGIILIAAWGVWATALFLTKRQTQDQSLSPYTVQVLLCFCLVLSLFDTKIMYAQIASANPGLLAKGPIQVLPRTTGVYLQTVLILSLACLGVLILQKSKYVTGNIVFQYQGYLL